MLVRSSRSEVFATVEDDFLLSNLHLKQSSTKNHQWSSRSWLFLSSCPSTSLDKLGCSLMFVLL